MKDKSYWFNWFPVYEEIPEGWKLDATWPSPFYEYAPISNGKSPLKGVKRGFVRILCKLPESNP